MKGKINEFECPLCKKSTKPMVGGEPEECNGIQIIIGGSEGGWGHRFNNINFTAEVCDECFLKIFKKSEELREILKLPKNDDIINRIKRFFNL